MEKRELVTDTTLRILRYKNNFDALSQYGNLSQKNKWEMASVYQGAFGGPPWFEVCLCPNCNQFSPDTICRTRECGTTNLPEAYPTEWLVNIYFPKMITEFNPGVLILAENEQKEVIGFSTGGFTSLKDLVEKKYGGNTQIQASIQQTTGLTPDELIFYENEACVLPSKQRRGVGPLLNWERINEGINMGATAFCGKSVNIPWLEKKRDQLKKNNFMAMWFTPEGDTYTVPNTGAKRQFFFAPRFIN